MGDSDVAQINDRLTRLEVQVVEKWSSHDKRSDERWADLMEKFHEMARKLEVRPCVQHGELMLGLDHRLKAAEAAQEKAMQAIAKAQEQTSAAITSLTNSIGAVKDSVDSDVEPRVLAIEKWINIAGWAIGVIYVAIIGAIITAIVRHL